MARIFTHEDGRLKTGRVAVLVFAGFLTICVMLFKVNSSVDHALVAVNHVFEPEKREPTRERPVIEPKTAKIEKPETKADDPKVKRPPEPPRTDETSKVDPTGKENRETEAPGRASTEKPPSESAKEKPPSHESEPKTINVAEKLKRLTGEAEEPAKNISSEKPKSRSAPLEEKFPEDAPREQEMTVDQKRYKDLFHSWRMAGKKGKGEQKLPLRVENLRDSYELFQMKPVAVIRGNTFFDLTDGTRVAEKSLEEYSATVFRVDGPWDKWGKALAAAGIRPGEECEVRYYMYDFIKDAIYARVNQAFSWCRREGLIAETLPPDSVDILGRAYVINRRGGGRFGVFVPVSLDTRDGRTIAVDPVCFQGQADVEALHRAGLL